MQRVDGVPAALRLQLPQEAPARLPAQVTLHRNRNNSLDAVRQQAHEGLCTSQIPPWMTRTLTGADRSTVSMASCPHQVEFIATAGHPGVSIFHTAYSTTLGSRPSRTQPRGMNCGRDTWGHVPPQSPCSPALPHRERPCGWPHASSSAWPSRRAPGLPLNAVGYLSGPPR